MIPFDPPDIWVEGCFLSFPPAFRSDATVSQPCHRPLRSRLQTDIRNSPFRIIIIEGMTSMITD
jgi:hypothetical protein